MGLPGGSSARNPLQGAQETRVRSLGRGENPWIRKWQPTTVFSARKSHERRSLVQPMGVGKNQLD